MVVDVPDATVSIKATFDKIVCGIMARHKPWCLQNTALADPSGRI